MSSAHVCSQPAVIWVRVLPASTPLVSTATGTEGAEGDAGVAEFAVVVVAPAVGGAGTVQRARGAEPGGDLGEGLAGQHAAGVHGHRDAGAAGVAVAELAEGVVAPAVGGAGTVQRAGIFSASGDLGKGLAGQHAAGVHGHRDVGVSRAAVAEFAIERCRPSSRRRRCCPARRCDRIQR